MTRTTLFSTNRSQAVRLPKGAAFLPDMHEVTILRDGPRRIIAPVYSAWDKFFASPGIDLGERNQPPPQVREDL